VAQFNRPAPARQPDALTYEGGAGFSREPQDELFLLGASLIVGADTFYERADDRLTRFVDLTHKVTATDPAWMRSFVRWLRHDAFIRSASVVAACEYVAAGGEGGRQVIASACARADEPGEVLGYWMGRHGRRIPKPIKRGLADAVARLYTERNLLRYDGGDRAIRWGDVIELVHPDPADDTASALYRFAIDRRHGHAEEGPPALLPTLSADWRLMRLPEPERRGALADAVDAGWSWERLAGWLPGGMDAAAWEAVVPNMGVMALMRNLRNFDGVNLGSDAAAAVSAKLTSAEDVRAAKVLPLRFLTAWRNTTSMRWGPALEAGLELAVANVPSLPGRTLVLVDVSGSMQDYVTAGGRGRPDGVSPQRWEVAGAFATALAKRAESADVVLFAHHPVAEMQVGPAESVLRIVEAIKPFVGGGTDTLGSLAAAWDGHDRAVVLTDEQTMTQARQTPCPTVTFNLAGYSAGHLANEGRNLTVGGLSDACFGLLGWLEDRRRSRWPWDAATS
jgi:hypothetical protein